MKIISYILSPIYYFFFGLTLGIFHIIQWLSYNLGGYHAHHKAVKAMDKSMLLSTKIMGTSYKYSGRELLPKDRPLIFVSNHQSMFDINPLEWYLADFHPKFISKIELGKGIPSVSYNLVKGGSALIDRKDSEQSKGEIKKLAEYIEKNKYSAIIFPEGTRSRDGKLKNFKTGGIRTLLEHSPSAWIVPITINNSWKYMKYGAFPLNFGTKITVEVHKPLDPKDYDFDKLMSETREIIKAALIN